MNQPAETLIDYGSGEPILEFKGEYDFLSNFYHVEFTYGRYPWRSVEHAYQWAKNPTDDFARFMHKVWTPGAAKRAGRRTEVRADWDDVKRDVMLDCLRLKFAVPTLREKLLATEERWLEEGNAWGDTFWGVSPVGSGNGQNVLGKLLMQVRADLRPL